MLCTIAESDGSDEEELFIVRKRAVKKDPSKESLKIKRAKIIQIHRPVLAGARFTKEIVSLSETGVLKIDVRVIKYDKPTMELIKKLGIDRSKLYIQNSSGSYLYWTCTMARTLFTVFLEQLYDNNTLTILSNGGLPAVLIT